MATSARINRELKTIAAMVKIYCRHHHDYPVMHAGDLCEECARFLEYAGKRLVLCPFAQQKPTCGNCTVHCYKKEMQAKAKQIMRYSGPRMIWSHPQMAFFHLLDGRKKAQDISFCPNNAKKKLKK